MMDRAQEGEQARSCQIGAGEEAKDAGEEGSRHIFWLQVFAERSCLLCLREEAGYLTQHGRVPPVHRAWIEYQSREDLAAQLADLGVVLNDELGDFL